MVVNDDTRVEDAGTLITNPYFKTPPLAPSDINEKASSHRPVDFISAETNYADSIGLVRWAPEWARRYLSTLIRGNVDRTHEKRIDMSFAVTPSYTREAGFGVGGALTALYRVDRRDSVMQPSDVFMSINASLNGFYVLTFKGNNLFNDHRSRLSYKLELYRKRLDFWGINSEQTANNAKSRYDRRQIDLRADYIYKINRNFYVGACLRADYTDARDVLNPAYLLGERRQYYVTGLGASFEFDTRDNLLTPTRGIHLAYRPMFFWKVLGSAPASFFNHTFIANTYFRLWEKGVLAYDLYASFNTSNSPWTMREMIASDGIRMRGYYMGSYIDNCQIASQIEYRQNIYRRIGATVWVGGATLFAALREFRREDIKPEWLPNYGIGLRFEFKHNVNARIDYGFGRHTSGILFAIGEAF
ncbi:MAG: BamA/TamA family outer membrane protein [Bacteroidales bacterium]|nr:BamA/TamA family outer membrane protein [Bacteroidales bacterium]